MPRWSTCKPATQLGRQPSPHIPVPHLHDVFTKDPFHWAQSESYVYNILPFIPHSPRPRIHWHTFYMDVFALLPLNVWGICWCFTTNYTWTCNDDVQQPQVYLMQKTQVVYNHVWAQKSCLRCCLSGSQTFALQMCFYWFYESLLEMRFLLVVGAALLYRDDIVALSLIRFRLKYLNNHDILYRHSWCPEDKSPWIFSPSDYSFSATMRLAFVVLNEMKFFMQTIPSGWIRTSVICSLFL